VHGARGAGLGAEARTLRSEEADDLLDGIAHELLLLDRPRVGLLARRGVANQRAPAIIGRRESAPPSFARRGEPLGRAGGRERGWDGEGPRLLLDLRPPIDLRDFGAIDCRFVEGAIDCRCGARDAREFAALPPRLDMRRIWDMGAAAPGGSMEHPEPRSAAERLVVVRSGHPRGALTTTTPEHSSKIE